MAKATKPPEVLEGFRDNDAAPFVYFDAAIAFGASAGVMQIELASRKLIPTADGGAKPEVVITGRLRCSLQAANSLRETIDKALQMLKQAQEGGSQTAAQSGKLN